MNPFTKLWNAIKLMFGVSVTKEQASSSNSNAELNTQQNSKFSGTSANRESESRQIVNSKLGMIKDSTKPKSVDSLRKLAEEDKLLSEKKKAELLKSNVIAKPNMVKSSNIAKPFENALKDKPVNKPTKRTVNNAKEVKHINVNGLAPQKSSLSSTNQRRDSFDRDYSSYQNDSFVDNMFMMQFPEVAPIYRPDSMLAWMLWYNNNQQHIPSNFELNSQNIVRIKNESWGANMPDLPIGADGVTLNKTNYGVDLSFTDIQKSVLGDLKYNQSNNEIMTGDNNLMTLNFDDLKSKINLELDGKSVSYSNSDEKSAWHIDTPLHSSPVVLESHTNASEKSWGVTSFDEIQKSILGDNVSSSRQNNVDTNNFDSVRLNVENDDISQKIVNLAVEDRSSVDSSFTTTDDSSPSVSSSSKYGY